MIRIFIFLFIINFSENCREINKIPIVINTWGFTNATIKAWEILNRQDKTAVSYQFIFDSLSYFIGHIIFRLMLLLEVVQYARKSNVMVL